MKNSDITPSTKSAMKYELIKIRQKDETSKSPLIWHLGATTLQKTTKKEYMRIARLLFIWCTEEFHTYW